MGSTRQCRFLHQKIITISTKTPTDREGPPNTWPMSSVQMIPLTKVSSVRKADMRLRRELTAGIIITRIELPLQMAEEAGHDRSIGENRRRNKSLTSSMKCMRWRLNDRTIGRMTGVVYSCINLAPGQAAMRLQRVTVGFTHLKNTINVLTDNTGTE